MDDLISRQAVRLIESDSNAYPEMWNESYEKGFCDAINRVLDLPSAQTEPHWIPSSERLPELDQICIVTDETRRCAYEYGLHDETYDDENGWTYLGHRIIAWMPLPEPYKGEEKNERRKP